MYLKGVNMNDMLTLVIASRNPGKTAEIRDLLKQQATPEPR